MTIQYVISKGLVRGVVLCAMIFFVACSGGSGGDGGGSEGRSRGTGVRVVHASIDTPPVELYLNEETAAAQTSRFAQPTSYVSADSGAQRLLLTYANSGGEVVRELLPTLVKNTEYTLFLYGSGETNSLQVAFLEDLVSQPVLGQGLVQVLHGYQGEGAIEVQVDNVPLATIHYGERSSFKEFSAGAHRFSVLDDDGDTITTAMYELPNQGELTLLVTGSRELGVVFTPIYFDLD